MGDNREIRQIYSQLDRKGDFNLIAAKKFNKTSATIKNHWINGDGLPLEYYKEFVKLLNRVKKIQDKYWESLNKLK